MLSIEEIKATGSINQNDLALFTQMKSAMAVDLSLAEFTDPQGMRFP